MLSIRKFLEGIGIVPKTTPTADTAGEMEVLSSDGRLRYHDGTSLKVVTLNNSTDTLTNKDIDADSNTIYNIENADIKAAAAIDASKIANGSVSNAEFQYLDGVTSGIQAQIDSKASKTLTSAHIYVGDGSNVAADVAVSGDITLDNTGNAQIATGVIVNADINASAAIDASKIANGSVSNAEFQRLDGIGSAAVGISDSQTLTNKTIDGDDNTVQDLALSSFKTNITDADKFLVRDASGVVVSNSKAVPTGAVVGTSDSQTLTNKTLTTPVTDIITFDDQASTPSNPSSGFYKTYFKTDGKYYKLNSSGVETEIGAGSGSGDAIKKTITQANSFSVGNVVYFNGSSWALAKADADSTSEVLGVISAASGSDFEVTQAGYISGLSGLTAGSTYYLSAASAGAITTTEPSLTGQISKPVLVAVSTSTAYVLQSRGAIIGSSSSGGVSGVTTTTITATTTNPTKGSIVQDKMAYTITGNLMTVHMTYQQNSAGSAGSGTYLFLIPSSKSVNTTSMQVGSQNGTNVGAAYSSSASDTNANGNFGYAFLYDSTHVAIKVPDGAGGASYIGSGASNLGVTNQFITFTATFIIN